MLQFASTHPTTEYPLELFFELSPDLLIIAGYDGYFKKINPAVSKLLGYTNEELYALPINSFVYHEDADLTEKMRTQLRSNKPLLNFENRYVTKAGEIVWLSWTSLPVPDERIVFAIAKNITHKKKLEEERNTLLAQFTRSNKELRQLNYTTSHDLRSPVGNLISVFELLDISKITDEETVEFIEMLKLASENLKQTLDNYVDALSQKEALHTNTVDVHIPSCLNKVMTSINSLVKSSQAVVKPSFAAFTNIAFNQAYMESILLNLITNSIKYAKPGVTPEIKIYTNKNGNTHQLIIADNGMGFNLEKVKDRMFGLYQKFTDNIDSKGVGLYLVHNHVTSLGGSIDVQSNPGEGATFIINFS